MSGPLCSLCLTLALILYTCLAQECPLPDDGYELFPSYNASRYKLPPFSLNWPDASAACQSDGGGSHLVVINTEEEAEVVAELVSRLVSASVPNPWVGINDIATEGTWVTVLGGLLSESGYEKWAPGYPAGGTVQNCGYIFTDSLYYDYFCSGVFPFICEKPYV